MVINLLSTDLQILLISRFTNEWILWSDSTHDLMTLMNWFFSTTYNMISVVWFTNKWL